MGFKLVDATQTDMRNAYFKAGLYGEQGSGKTHTAVNLAIGIAKQIGADSIGFYDTERAAGFHTDRVKQAKLKFYLEVAQSLKGAIDFLQECERIGVGCVVIDSATHLWRELTTSYCKAKNIQRPAMRDWQVLKPQWFEFAHVFVHSKVHIIACGRAGIITEELQDENGKNDGFRVTGTKMKSEGEFGYEASLELEMERRNLTPKLRKELKSQLPKEKHAFLERADANVCVVKKDRNPNPKTSMMGREIYFPMFSDFKDHMSVLNFGGTFVEHKESDTSASLFANENGSDMYAWKRRRDTILSHLWDEVIPLSGLDGTGKDVKQARVRALVDVFGTAAIPAIEDMPTKALLDGIDKLRRLYQLPPYDKEQAVVGGEPAVPAALKSDGGGGPGPVGANGEEIPFK